MTKFAYVLPWQCEGRTVFCDRKTHAIFVEGRAVEVALCGCAPGQYQLIVYEIESSWFGFDEEKLDRHYARASGVTQ